jgi:hypothetical protein
VVISVNALLIVILKGAVAVAAAKSVTFTVKLEVPVVVGLPVMAPVEEFRCSPGGKAPAMMLQV